MTPLSYSVEGVVQGGFIKYVTVVYSSTVNLIESTVIEEYWIYVHDILQS